MPSVTLNGFPCLASQAVRWGYRTGTEPVVAIVHLEPDHVKQLANSSAIQRHGAILTIDNQKWEGLSIVGFPPGPNPYIAAVQIADRRWWWPYKWILRRYNFRRNVGFRRRKLFDDAVLQIVPVREIAFAQWSLRDKKFQWLPKEVLEDIITAVDDGSVSYSDNLMAGLKGLNVDSLPIDDPGNVAVQKALEVIAGAEVYIRKDGSIRFVSAADSSELAVINAAGPEIMQGGHVDLDTAELIRPEAIEVLFTIKSEVKLEVIETVTTEVVEGQRAPTRTMHNVLPLPDYSLEMSVVDSDGNAATSDITQGTWVRFLDYLIAIVAQASAVPERGLLKNMTPQLWFNVIRRAFIPETNLWSSLFLAASSDLVTGNKADWASRLAAFQTHFRTTYRIDSKWMDHTLAIEPFTVGTVDIAEGQRSPAIVWSNYAVKNAWKFLVSEAKANGNDYTKVSYARNVHAYDSFAIDPNARPSPANVVILDPDQGVIQIQYRLDPYKNDDLVFPSLLTGVDGMANPRNAKQSNRVMMFGQSSKNGTAPELSATHKAAVLLTMVPAAPNTEDQLYKIRVEPQEIADRLPPGAGAGLMNAKGPVKQVRVSAAFAPAFVRWLDSRSADIEKIFGARDGAPNFSNLVTNDTEGPSAKVEFPGGAAVAPSIREIARATAAAIYAEFRDRALGQKTVPMNFGLEPTGNLDAVWHEVQPNGILTTTITLPSKPRKLNVRAFMDAGTRSILDRELAAPKKASS